MIKKIFYIDSSWIDFRYWLSKEFDYCVHKPLEQDFYPIQFLSKAFAEELGYISEIYTIQANINLSKICLSSPKKLETLPVSCSNHSNKKYTINANKLFFHVDSTFLRPYALH